MMYASRSSLLFLLALTLGCAGAGQAGSEPPPESASARPSAESWAPPAAVDVRPAWTVAFQGEAVLLAHDVQIEGPKGLLEHVAVAQDPVATQYEIQTLPEGLRQETRVLEGAEDVVIRAHLDAWNVVATGRLVVLERPGSVPVRVLARGDAWWSSMEGAGERRGDRLSFEGHLGDGQRVASGASPLR